MKLTGYHLLILVLSSLVCSAQPVRPASIGMVGEADVIAGTEIGVLHEESLLSYTR